MKKENQNQSDNFYIGQIVECNGIVDEIVGFVQEDDLENYGMGYRLILRENGTQSFGCVGTPITSLTQ